MLGKQLNSLCKTTQIVTDSLPIKEVVKLVDNAHVMMMIVHARDGSPVLGTVSEGLRIDTKPISKIKIGDAEELTASVDVRMYTLANDDASYSFVATDNASRDPAVPELSYDRAFENVDVKKLSAFVAQALTIIDYVIFEYHDGKLTVSAESEKNGTRISRVIQEDKSASWSEDIRVMYPADYLKKILGVAQPGMRLSLATKYPLTAEWSDQWYDYTVLLAPRIETE